MPVIISSNKEGFRRCGIPHSKAPVEYPDDRFTKEELDRLIAEPKLSVTIIPAKETKAAGESTQGAAAPAKKEVSVEDTDKSVPDPEKDTPLDKDLDQGQAGDLAPKILDAARKVVAAGDTIKSGAPDLKALEKILGRDVDAAERDLAWEAIQAEVEA